MRNRSDLIATIVALAKLAIVIALCIILCGYLLSPQPSPNLVLGNPSGASTSTSNNYLLVKPEYALSYNQEKGTPNWVEWELNSHDIGKVPRNNDFHPEPALPRLWRVEPDVYRGSGFDRGHICPSGDRTTTPEENFQTFSMANMVPQSPDNNRGPWEKLEKYERKLARSGKQLYIIAGRIGEGGIGAYGGATLLESRVSVPQSLWKVLIVLNRNYEQITRDTRAIAVIMPNIQGIREENWRSYLTTIDAIEKQTGYNLLSNVSADVQRVIEARVDQQV
jgi:endonuclease G